MLLKCPFRIGLILLLFAIPYLCDVISSDELINDLIVDQVTALETDLDEDKAAVGTSLLTEMVVVPKTSLAGAAFSGVINSSPFYDSQTILVVSGSRPPPAFL